MLNLEVGKTYCINGVARSIQEIDLEQSKVIFTEEKQGESKVDDCKLVDFATWAYS